MTQSRTASGPTETSGGEIERALGALRAVIREVHRRAANEWFALDLSMAQIKALFYLAGDAGSTVSHLAEALGIGKPAASILVDGLVQRGYVVRTQDRTDRRRVLTRLSPTGEELATRLRAGGPEKLKAEVTEWLTQLDTEDLHALAHGLDALARVAATQPAHQPAHQPARTEAQDHAAAGA